MSNHDTTTDAFYSIEEYNGSMLDSMPIDMRDLLHDVRNSLNGIVLGLSHLEHHWKSMTLTDFTHALHRVQEQSLYVRDILDRQSDVVLNDAPQKFIIEELDITTIVAAVVRDYQDRALAKHIQILFQPLIVNTIILGDRLTIRQIIDNVLSNAIKFSPLHSTVDVFVTVSCFSAASSELSTHWEIPLEENEAIRFVRVEIHDNGPGITIADKQRLFTAGARLSAKPTAGEHSTGFGLSIVKKLVDSMSGLVWCESYPEQGKCGSRFIVEFPLSKEM